MPTKEIERLAEAMVPELNGWDRDYDGVETIAYNAAIALLTALRTPSEEMLEATLEVVDWSEGHDDDDWFNKRNSERRWQAMIDHILSD